MKTLEITTHLPGNFDLPAAEAGEVVHSAFGGRGLEECIDDAVDHLRTAKLLQVARSSGGSAVQAFAMYERFDDPDALYLNGIVVRREAQGRGLGRLMLGQAIQELEPALVFAYTRSPNMVRTFNEVCVESTPSLGGVGLSLDNDVMRSLAELTGSPTSDLPYHRGRYPTDLYDAQPTNARSEVQLAFEEQLDLHDMRDGIMVVGKV